MQTNHPDVPWLGPEYFENQRNFPRAQLLPFAGQYIAWSWDGSRILESDPREDALFQKLQAAGIDTNRVIIDFVDPPELVNL